MASVLSRVFVNGNSQAVRIPQEFRLDVSRVEVSRNEQGDLIIHPIITNRGEAFFEAICAFDDEFVKAFEDERRDEQPTQDREDL